MSSPIPKSPEQSDKAKKYDRQLRLWGDHGQKLLEKAKICLINATAVGTEILKSLVLPGIGAFTVVDGEKVTEEDIGSNFFLENEFLGLSRAEAATKCLLELNPDVAGDYIDETPETVMSDNGEFFNNFTIVVANNLSEKVLVNLSRQLWDARIPFLYCKSIGFMGYLRVQLKEHTIIEAHPENEYPDLRLSKPWPALKEHLDQINITNLDKKERSHVPALSILYYYLKIFKNNHGGNLPKSRAEKEELRDLIRCSGDGVLEENFEEAIRFVNTCTSPNLVPSSLSSILEDSQCLNITQKSSPFWIMANALREFIQSEGELPLKGNLPDMAADTNSYVTLQQLYQKHATEQTEVVHRRVTQILRQIGQSSDLISEADVRLFCRHASELCVIKGTSIADEYRSSNSLDLSGYLEGSQNLLLFYIIFRAIDRFFSEFNTYPGQFDDQVEPDVLKLKTIIGKLLNEWGCTSASPAATIRDDEHVHEVCRYGGAVLHSVSATIGAAAAHEVIKLITHQYRPIDNTFIYDAVSTNSMTFKL